MNLECASYFTWSGRRKFLHLPLLQRPDGHSIHILLVLLWWMAASDGLAATKVHTVFLGSGKMVPYSVTGDPASALPTERQLRVRPLLVDEKVKEWTTGESHPITDRSFVVRRALRLNDSLPGDKTEHWIWQRGPWLMVDRVKGSVTALHLPDYDPAISNVIWFRDYAAYCGLTTSGKQLYAVFAQIAARKPVLAKKLSARAPEDCVPDCCGRSRPGNGGVGNPMPAVPSRSLPG